MSTFERAKAELAAAARKYGLGFVADCGRCGTMLVVPLLPTAPNDGGRMATASVACPVPHCGGHAEFDMPATQVDHLGPARAPNALRGDQHR